MYDKLTAWQPCFMRYQYYLNKIGRGSCKGHLCTSKIIFNSDHWFQRQFFEDFSFSYHGNQTFYGITLNFESASH